ncbi:hypothetical protein OZ410_13185 [Robiginitalea sp. M366]|uniref:hypothetical protein n=1 Tax=Robiginitalea aestuariiviva TaxID=3036903 RepID=UPI00240E6E8A|nr:hypothetical protein [Robiginitalea aestuariiviva]MDG1573277.1 hypothetical protein [Robiginitalea aestuariiviva]
MPGIATHFKILERSMSELKSSGDSSLIAIGQLMETHSKYAYLGAIGPILADFIPSDPPPDLDFPFGYGNEYTALWKNALKFAGDNPANGAKGMITILAEFQEFLGKIQPIADNEDLGALKDMRDNGEVDSIMDTAAALSSLVADLTKIPDGFVLQIAGIIGGGLKPVVNVAVGSEIPVKETWTIREQLFWRQTGEFVQKLVEKAESSGRDEFKAYAYGYVTSYAGLVCGSPFLNSIVGGTYRTDWWRQRWIGVFVDAWVHGYYETPASLSGDTPSPPYDQWKGLCEANLQEKIQFDGVDIESILEVINTDAPFPSVLPADFIQYWRETYESVYGPIDPLSRFKDNSLNAAYQMTWAMLWFQTSGYVVGCNPAPPMRPPEDCSTEPSWADPTVPGDSGGGSVPPEPTIEKDADVGKIITGVILALLGLGQFAAGGLISGGAAIAFGVEQIIEGANDINWAKLRCDLYWYRMYLYRGLKALHEVMVLGGLQHPYPSELREDPIILNFLGFEFEFDSIRKNAKSQVLEVFPPKPWSGAIGLVGLWNEMPSRPQENPGTIAYLSTGKYPDFFIDDDTNNPLAKGKVSDASPTFLHTDGGKVGQGPVITGANRPVEFGNAVANALDLFKTRAYPNWNLDADRGLAYQTWAFGIDNASPATYQDPVEIHPVNT